MNKETETFAPKPAKSPKIAGDMSCREAAIRSFDFYFRNLLWNEKGALIGKDPEFLHYLRVASKRLRVALTVFKKYFPEDEISRYKMNLKSLAPMFGKARDTDVYLEFLNDKASGIMNPKELKVINNYKEFFVKRRKFRQKAVLKKLNSEDYKLFVSEFTNFISCPPVPENKIPESPVSEIIDRKIKSKVERLLEHSRKLNHKSSDSKLHKFRKKCRKLRYEVEISLNITGNRGEELDRILIELQHSLGSHHDAVTAGKKINSYIKTHKEYSKSRALRKLRQFQNERALKYRKRFFAMATGNIQNRLRRYPSVFE
jgi:CHAD domain-containing protein